MDSIATFEKNFANFSLTPSRDCRHGIGQGVDEFGEGKSFAKFVSKFAMLCIFPLREISCEI
jgi:hypothetical protein